MKSIQIEKRAQSEVVTTTLLILIGLTATVILSYFVINMINDKLTDKTCFDYLDQIKISPAATYFNVSSKILYFSIERESKEFELTGLRLNYGNDLSRASVVIKEAEKFDWLEYYNKSSSWENTKTGYGVRLPKQGESVTFRLNSSKVPDSNVIQINILEITPIINGQQCSKKMDSLTVRQIN